MARSLRWGILGTGNIAGQFAAGMAESRRGLLAAVGSRSQASADSFSKKFHVSRAYGSYDQLLSDPEVDAIYLSLPNSLHHQWTLLALAAGKHVLCEKPIATNVRQVEEMFDAAKKVGRILAEAFMYVSHPQTKELLRTIRSGAIGPVRMVRTSFCFRTNKIDGNIRFKPEMAGGALMDVGCYCLHFSRLMIGAEPTSVHAVARMHESGVDEMTSGVLGFPDGAAATFSCGTRVQADNTAAICGTEGYLEVPWPWKPQVTGATFTLARNIPPKQDGPPVVSLPPRESFATDATAPLYAMEADDFAAAVLDGAPPMISRADSLANMKLLDEIRRQIGLNFPS